MTRSFQHFAAVALITYSASVFSGGCASTPDRWSTEDADCTPGAVKCSGNEVLVCDTTATEWSHLSWCGSGETCDTGRCVPLPTDMLFVDSAGSSGGGGVPAAVACNLCNIVRTYEIDTASLAFANYSDKIDIVDAIRQGAEMWNSLSNGHLVVKEVPSGGDVKIRFVSEPISCNGAPAANVAGCSPLPLTCSGIQYINGEIQLRNVIGTTIGATYVIPDVAHEMGHILGLDHTNNDCTQLCSTLDIMCCTVPIDRNINLTTNDKNKFASVWGTCNAQPPDCSVTCLNAGAECGTYNGCNCGQCGVNQYCSGNTCLTQSCSTICQNAGAQCGTYSGCNCGQCPSGKTCVSNSCTSCVNGQTQSVSCSPGFYCPLGTKTQTCSGGQWFDSGTCEANLRYYGDGGTRCGSQICVTISPQGSDTQLQATLTKNDGGTFQNDVFLVLYSPTTTDSIIYGCVPTANKSSYTVSFNPAQLNFLSLGTTYAINAQIFSPCVNGASYVSGNGSVSKCSN